MIGRQIGHHKIFMDTGSLHIYVNSPSDYIYGQKVHQVIFMDIVSCLQPRYSSATMRLSLLHRLLQIMKEPGALSLPT